MAVNISNSVLLSIEGADVAEVKTFFQHFDGVIEYLCGCWSIWQLLLTMMLLLATCDQGKFGRQVSDV